MGRARALLDLGQYVDAAAAAAAVPTDFRYDTEHADSPQRLQNAIWSYTNGGLWSVSDAEGGNGLPYISALDPRVGVDSLDDDEDGSPIPDSTSSRRSTVCSNTPTPARRSRSRTASKPASSRRRPSSRPTTFPG